MVAVTLKVAFNGTHSTGKTTLLETCKAYFGARIYAIEDLPREIMRQGFPMGKNATLNSFARYIRDQLRTQREVPQNAALLISNRTCIDAYAYASANQRLELDSAQPQYVIDMIEEVAICEANSFNSHVYFPIEFALHPDSYRPEGEQYQAVVDEEITSFLNKHSLPFLRMSGTPEQRWESLSAHLADIGVSYD